MTGIPALPHPSPVPVPVCFFCAQAAALIGHGSKWICSSCLNDCGHALWPNDGEPAPGDLQVIFRERIAAASDLSEAMGLTLRRSCCFCSSSQEPLVGEHNKLACESCIRRHMKQFQEIAAREQGGRYVWLDRSPDDARPALERRSDA